MRQAKDSPPPQLSWRENCLISLRYGKELISETVVEVLPIEEDKKNEGREVPNVVRVGYGAKFWYHFARFWGPYNKND